MLRNFLFSMVLAAGWHSVLRQATTGGGGLRILHVVDTVQRPLPISPDGVCVHAYLLDSVSGLPVRPLWILPDREAPPPNSDRMPAQISLSPQTGDAQGHPTTSRQRLVLAWNADTMVVDFIDVRGRDGSGKVDELDTLEFRPGYMVARRDPARACPKIWHHTRKKEQKYTLSLLRSGLHSAVLPALMAQGLVEFTPAPPRQQTAAPSQAVDPIPYIQLVASVADFMVLRLNGIIMTNGACVPDVFVGLQRWDSTWQDISGRSTFSQMDCGASTKLCPGISTVLQISMYKVNGMRNTQPFPPGRYRAVVLDSQGQEHFSEEVVYTAQPILPPPGSSSFHELCLPAVIESPSSIRINAGNPHLRIGATDTYFFKGCAPRNSLDMDDFALPATFVHDLATHELIINGKPFSGCFVMALKNTFGRFDHLHILYRQYYHKGKLVWRDTVSAFNLDSGEQEVTYD